MPPVTGNTTTTGENAAGPLNGTELVRGVQAGGNVKMTTAAIAALGYQTPLTTKGDLVVSNGSNDVRQAVGADGSQLTADSTQPLGVKWHDGIGALIANLVSTLAGKGAATIGSNDAANYFNGATVEALLQELGNPKGQFQLDGVNVLRYIPPAEWANVINGTSTTDLYAYLQSALTAEPNLVFPDGLFNTGTKLVPRVDSKIRAINRRATKLRATAAITILEYPINNVDPYVEKIRFQGPAGYTGISVATTAGTYQGYLIRPHIKDCDFDYATSGFGINADCIYAHIQTNTFGAYSEVVTRPAAGSGSFTGLKSYVYPATTNYANLNVLEGNIFDGCGGQTSGTTYALDLSGGTGWTLRGNDFSYGGVQIRTANIQALKFEGTNWFEGNVATNAIVEFGACTTPIDLKGANWSNNTCDRLVQAPLDGTCKGIEWSFNEISKSGSTYCLFDTVSLTRVLPGNGSVAFYKNNVNGGSGSDKLVTGTDFRGGLTSPRLVMVAATTTPGTINAKSDPGATISYNGVGDVSITGSHPFASSTANVAATATPQVGFQTRVQVINASQVRVQIQNPAGAAVDGAFSLTVCGS